MDAEKNNHKEGKVLHKLLNNAIYGKIMEHLRNTIDVKLVNNEKDYLKCTSKPSYMSHKYLATIQLRYVKANLY